MSKNSNDIEALVVVVLGAAAIVIGLYAAILVIPVAIVIFAGYMIYRWKFNSPKEQERQSREFTQELYEKTKLLVGNIPDKDEFTTAVYKRLPSAPEAVELALIEATFNLYNEEYAYSQIPEPPVVCNTIEGARYRDFLSAYGAKITNAAASKIAIDAMVDGFRDFLQHVPELSDEGPTLFSTPLTSLMPNVNRAVNDLILPFYGEEIISLNLFGGLREQIDRNLKQASTPTREILPAHYDGDDAPFVYLKNTPLLDVFKAHIPIHIEHKTRFEGHWIVSPQGGGKTQTFQAMIHADMELVARDEASIVIINSTRDLIEQIAYHKSFAKGGALEGKLILIEPDLDFPPALNPFAFGSMLHGTPTQREQLSNSALDLLLYVFSGLLETEMTPKQETLFRYCIRACMIIPNATIDTFAELLKDKKPFAASIATLAAPARDFFEREYDSQFRTTRDEVGWRLKLMRESTIFDRMVSSVDNKFNFYTELASSKVIIINTDKDGLKDRSSIFGRLFIAMLLHAAERRDKIDRTARLPVFCYIDEFGEYGKDSRVAIILDQARKMNIGMVLANQRLSHITAPGLMDAMQNCGIKFARDANDSDASALARNMNTTADFIRSQPAQCFAAYVRGTTPSAVSLKVPFFIMEHEPKMTEDEKCALHADMRERYTSPHYPEAEEPKILRVAEPDPDKPSKW